MRYFVSLEIHCRVLTNISLLESLDTNKLEILSSGFDTYSSHQASSQSLSRSTKLLTSLEVILFNSSCRLKFDAHIVICRRPGRWHRVRWRRLRGLWFWWGRRHWRNLACTTFISCLDVTDLIWMNKFWRRLLCLSIHLVWRHACHSCRVVYNFNMWCNSVVRSNLSLLQLATHSQSVSYTGFFKGKMVKSFLLREVFEVQ